jgi:hypothetical protein
MTIQHSHVVITNYVSDYINLLVRIAHIICNQTLCVCVCVCVCVCNTSAS